MVCHQGELIVDKNLDDYRLYKLSTTQHQPSVFSTMRLIIPSSCHITKCTKKPLLANFTPNNAGYFLKLHHSDWQAWLGVYRQFIITGLVLGPWCWLVKSGFIVLPLLHYVAPIAAHCDCCIGTNVLDIMSSDVWDFKMYIKKWKIENDFK